MDRRLVLIAGPSGSGKSRLTGEATRSGTAVAISLDDFYRDADFPGMPMTPMGIPDWDRVECWDRGLALATIARLLRDGEAELPVYDISQSRRVGSRHVSLGDAQVLIAEGIFAIDMLAAAREAGIDVRALWLDRPRTTNFARRLTRDLREHRKPAGVLLHRGAALFRAEPSMRNKALAAGFTPASMRSCLRQLSRSEDRLAR